MTIPKRILAVAVLSTVGLLGMSTPSADASTAGGGVFAGVMNTGPGMFAPIAPFCIGICPGIPGGWALNANGAGAAASVNALPTTVGNAGPNLFLAGSGTYAAGLGGLGPWCGWWSGSGSISASFSGLFGSYTTPAIPVHWLQSLGTVMVLTSEVSLGASVLPTTSVTATPSDPVFVAVLQTTLPFPGTGPGGDCLNSPGNFFQFIGAAVVADL